MQVKELLPKQFVGKLILNKGFFNNGNYKHLSLNYKKGVSLEKEKIYFDYSSENVNYSQTLNATGN